MAVSRGYKQALALLGKPRNLNQNPQVWYRYQAIAKDKRLAAIDPSILPDSYTALYEMTRMPDYLIDAVIRSGMLSRNTSSRVLREVRITGLVTVKVKAEQVLPDKPPGSI